MLINDIAFLLRKEEKTARKKGKLNLHDAADFSSYAIHGRRCCRRRFVRFLPFRFTNAFSFLFSSAFSLQIGDNLG